MSDELQQTRYDSLLRRVGGLLGPGAKVATVVEDLLPVIDVERVPGELLALAGTRLCVGSASLTGAVGERARVQIFNPVGSGIIATVSQAVLSSGSSVTVHGAVNQTQIGSDLGLQTFRDGRFPVASRPVCQISLLSSVAQTDANMVFRFLANVVHIYRDENSIAVLPPGSGLEFGATSTATLLVGTFFWRERPAEAAELNISG